jgi:hypothetical protein
MRIVFLGNFGVEYSSETHHKKSLESLGHEVIALQETQAGSEMILEEALKSSMFVWVHTHGWETPGEQSMETVLKKLKEAGVPTVTYHLDLWLGLQRQADLEKDPVYKSIQHFFTVDKKMADWFNENTEVEGHYLPAGVFGDECYMKPVTQTILNRHVKPGQMFIEEIPIYQNEVIFVGSRGYHPEYKYRPQLIDWLHLIFGDKFKHYGGDGLGVVRGDALNQLYADTKVVVGDSLNIGFDYPGYWSDRIYETTGRGGFIIHPEIEGLETQFEYGKEIVTYKYGDFADLEEKINHYLTYDQEREAIRKAGFERTKRDHTYARRWEHIINMVTVS